MKVELACDLSDAIGIEPSDAGFVSLSIGTPGPYQKITVLHSDESWRPLFISKLGLTPVAQELVAKEAVVLRELSRVHQLAGRVPVLLAEKTAQGSFCFRQSLAIGPQWLAFDASKPILEMLESLGQATEIVGRLGEANVYRVLQERAKLLEDKVSPAWSKRIALVCSWVRAHAHMEGRFVRAHRDFVHWNIKKVGGKPFVYDWEYSEDGYPDAFDALHFMLMPIAAKGMVTDRAVGAARAFAEVVRDRSRGLDLSVQLVLYAFDICTFYLVSNEGRDEGDKVVAAYGELIDRICPELVS